MEFADVLPIVSIVSICISILWMFIKRDQSAGSQKVCPRLIEYNHMDVSDKIKTLSKKMDDQRLKLKQAMTKNKNVGNCLEKLKKFQIKAHLQYNDEIMQCLEAIVWLQESDQYRKRFRGHINLLST